MRPHVSLSRQRCWLVLVFVHDSPPFNEGRGSSGSRVLEDLVFEYLIQKIENRVEVFVAVAGHVNHLLRVSGNALGVCLLLLVGYSFLSGTVYAFEERELPVRRIGTVWPNYSTVVSNFCHQSCSTLVAHFECSPP